MSNIGNINRVVPGLIENINSPKLVSNADSAKDIGGDFGGLLSKMIQNVGNAQAESGQLEQAMLAGEPVELHQVMIKAEEAGGKEQTGNTVEEESEEQLGNTAEA